MTGIEVALAALGITATVAGALVWLLKKLFDQNDTTLHQNTAALTELTKTLTHLNASIAANDKADREFQKTVLRYLVSLDKKADRNHDATIGKQTVENQTVIQQTVQEAEGDV